MRTSRQLTDSVREALIDGAYRQGMGGTLMNLMALAGIWWLELTLDGDGVQSVWLAAMLALVLLRGLAIFTVAARPVRWTLARKERLFVLPLVLTSLMWAALPLHAFPASDVEERMALTVIMAGMAGGGASVLAGLGWPARLYLVCMLAPASVLLAQHEDAGRSLAALGIAYLAVILYAHWHARGMLIEAQQRLEHNRRLSAVADAERARAEDLNRELLATQARLRDHNTRLEETVAERTEKMRLAAAAIENTAEGVMVTDPEGTVLEVNPAFARITGFQPAELLGRKADRLRPLGRQGEQHEEMWAQLRRDGNWSGELWSCGASGGTFLERRVVNAVRDPAGQVTHYVAVLNDITEARRKDERILHLAFHDALTGLPNRMLIEDRIRHGIAHAARKRERLALLFIDLDQFKGVNDGLGHQVGDLLLQHVAERIGARIRDSDTLARLGGDEFIVLMEGVADAEHCARLAQDLLDALEEPVQILTHSIRIGASVGIAVYPDDALDQGALLRNADIAMYAAKGAGRGTYRFFHHEMSRQASYRLALESELRRAIEDGDLALHYQAKLAAADGTVAGYEALLRWNSERRGMVPPASFIPVAEDSGLIGRIGRWTFTEACRQIARWHQQGHGWQRVAVNVSARQMLAGDLAANLRAAADEAGVAPELLEVELTESVLMSKPAETARVLAELKEMGVTVAIDDFGTGYSSLAYLRRMPIDILKIDRSFVSEAPIDENGLAIIRTILSLGKALRLVVVAEGVETAEQASLLREMGCDQLQGFHLARPQPAAELERAWRAGEAPGARASRG